MRLLTAAVPTLCKRDDMRLCLLGIARLRVCFIWCVDDRNSYLDACERENCATVEALNAMTPGEMKLTLGILVHGMFLNETILQHGIFRC